MVRILYRSGAGVINTEDTPDQLPELLKDKDGLIWVDVHSWHDDARPGKQALDAGNGILGLLRDVFRFHPLSIEDALNDSNVPKVDDWGEYLYLTLHAVDFDKSIEDIDLHELDAFVGANYLVTLREEEIRGIDRVFKQATRDARHTKRGPDYLLYQVCDAVATDYLPCMDAIDEESDRVQDEVFERPTRKTLNTIFHLKKAVLNLRRVLSPQREVFNKLAREDYVAIDQSERIYFRDIYDHFLRLTDLNESLRDLITGSLDTYLSVVANRTNEITKTLTIVTVLFMPLTFATGFFGMNFFASLIEVTSNPDPLKLAFFVLILASMIFVPGLMLIFFRVRGWFGQR
ncbi:MAG: magnesium/cobalt transporter CorA [Anaerolineae bacterium]|nr:magnesium/cobalt transporter CorA [Anaerolineae bacterium]